MPNSLNDLCIVNVESQTMSVKCKNGFTKQYAISTSAKGIGNESGSYQTPIGLHTVCDKIGAFAPLYTIFKCKENTGILCDQINKQIQDDLILTRILRLSGEEPGINQGTNQAGTCVDSHDRYIYIHGTNREDLLSTPASKGCIRMANSDIAELFLKLQQGTIVDIRPNQNL